MQKKIILIFFSLILLSNLLGCKHNVAEKNDSQTEDSENETELSEDESDGKTYLEITNSSQFDVRIYLQTVTAGDPWASVKVGETVKQEISASATKAGDGISNLQHRIHSKK